MLVPLVGKKNWLSGILKATEEKYRIQIVPYQKVEDPGGTLLETIASKINFPLKSIRYVPEQDSLGDCSPCQSLRQSQCRGLKHTNIVIWNILIHMY
jgi:hypothetical protein